MSKLALEAHYKEEIERATYSKVDPNADLDKDRLPLRRCMHAYIPTYVGTLIHTYTHTYIHTYIHTYMDIYGCAHRCMLMSRTCCVCVIMGIFMASAFACGESPQRSDGRRPAEDGALSKEELEKYMSTSPGRQRMRHARFRVACSAS